MAGTHHDALVELLRSAPRTLSALLRQHRVHLPPSARAQPLVPSARQLRPVEFDADLVLRYAWREHRHSVIVEVQRAPDPDKRRTWPLYFAHFQARSSAPLVLVVVATNVRTAQWAREPIVGGGGQLYFEPLVLGPDDIPVLDDAQAQAQPVLAMLSALVHLEHPQRLAIALRAARAWEALSEADAATRARTEVDPATLGHYLDVLMHELGAADTEQLEEALMQPDTNSFTNRLLDRGRAEGRAEGVATAVLDLLKLRGFAVDAATHERVMSCTDLDTLRGWHARAVNADTLEAIFGDG